MAKRSYRRRATRIAADQACLCILDGGSALIRGRIVNVSSSGLLISASEELGFSVGSRVLVLLTSDGGVEVGRIARGESLYTGTIVRTGGAEGFHSVGVELDRRPANVLSRLLRRVASLLHSS